MHDLLNTDNQPTNQPFEQMWDELICMQVKWKETQPQSISMG